jgi:ATP-dependent RNA helicase DeaD
MLKRELILKQVPNGEEICEIQLLKLVDKVVKTEVSSQINKYLPAITEKLAHLDKEELLKHFISAEFNRFLAFYKNASNLNVSSNSSSRDDSRSSSRNDSRDRSRPNNRDRKSNNKGGSSSHAEEGYTRFFINLGNQKNMQAQNLIGMINEFTKQRNIPVGKIDIFKNFSFFEVDSQFEGSILSSFKGTEWNGERVSVEISKAPGGSKDENKKPEPKSRNFRERKETKGKRGASKESSTSSSSAKQGSFKSRFSDNKTSRKRR